MSYGPRSRDLGWKLRRMVAPGQSACVVVAVFGVVAAVGLWMAAAWGGVIWLLAAAGYVLLEVLNPDIFGRQFMFMAVICVLILVYFFLMFMASRTTEE